MGARGYQYPSMIVIEIDRQSGFCNGVVHAIRKAEQELATVSKGKMFYCLGDIVHNKSEVDRLKALGLSTINYQEFEALEGGEKVLFRAHGEPPSIYRSAQKREISIIDATCPVVLQLQKRIRQYYQEGAASRTQIVIFGKRGHAEVNGLVGQTNGEAIVIQEIEEIEQLDFSRPISLISQTTMSLEIFGQIVEEIKRRMHPGVHFTFADTICRQVALRIPHIEEFARSHDRIFFIAGKKSSNGRVLFEKCRTTNPLTYFLDTPEDLTSEMLPSSGDECIGICGATSTPRWQMEALATHLQHQLPNSIVR